MFDPSTFRIYRNTCSLEGVVEALDKGSLLMPQVRSSGVIWATGLVECLILRAGIGNLLVVMGNPVLEDGKYVSHDRLVDGAARISMLDSFLKDGWKAQGSKYFPALNGKLFSELDPATRRRIRESEISLVEMDTRMTSDMKMDYASKVMDGETLKVLERIPA